MFADLLRNSPLLVLPILGLGVFVTLFAAAVAAVFTKSARDYQRLAELPLDPNGEDRHDPSAE